MQKGASGGSAFLFCGIPLKSSDQGVCQSMIRKSMPSGHDPMGGYRFSLGTNAKRLPERSCSNKKIERDDNSKKSHPALVLAYCPCFETLASLAPQHEVVVFQRVRPHPRVTASPLSLEEVTNGSRECAPDDRLRGRLDGLQYRFVIPGTGA